MLTDIPCRGKISVNTFPNFGNGMIGSHNVSETPDREESVCLRRYPRSFRDSVEIEITTETLRHFHRGLDLPSKRLTGNAALLPKPGR
jgi:hypothetical protein